MLECWKDIKYESSVDSILQILELFPENDHRVLHDGRSWKLPHWLYCEDKLVLFFAFIILKSTYWNVVFVLVKVKRLCCLFALHAKNALFGPGHLKYSLPNIEDLSGTRIANGDLLVQRNVYSVVNFDLGFGMVCGEWTGGPSCVHFTDSFLDIKLDVDLLVRGKFNNRNAEFLVLGNIGKISNRANCSFLVLIIVHAAKNCLNVQRSHFSDLLVRVFDVQNKILLASSAILDFLHRTLALPRVVELVGPIAYKRNQSDPLAQPFIVKYRSVLNYTHQMWS